MALEYKLKLGEMADIENVEKRIKNGLKEVGMTAADYAADLAPWDTGNLRNSMDYTVDGNSVEFGTNSYYAIYQEFGTGIYAEGGGGRPGGWSYQDMNGDWHHTMGNRPVPFIRPAATEHTEEYLDILRDAIFG